METQTTEQKRYLDINGLASYLGASKGTLYKMVERRDIPFIKFGGKKSLKFDVRAIDKWMEKQLIPARPKEFYEEPAK